MNLYIKNMVCHCYKAIVKENLEKLGIHYTWVKLNEVILETYISSMQPDNFD